MQQRVYNFSPGPATLPLAVLEEVQRDLPCLPGEGVSVMEISHRSPWFTRVMEQTEANLRQLLALPDNYRVVFLQGGARLQFAMAPMNLLGTSGSADYIVTGSWGRMASEEAQRIGQVRLAYNGKATNYNRLPEPGQLDLDPQADYVHFTSNETIQGVQFATEPEVGQVPLVCDASSDFLSYPVPIGRYGLLYACAQKNAGPAGVTLVIIRDDLLGRSTDKLPSMLNYRLHVEKKSTLNTPSVFGVYVVGLVTRWLLDEIGGLEQMQELNRRKAALLYEIIDDSDGFYRGHAQPASRSLMNVTYRLPDDDTQARFLSQAESQGLCYLKGHRSVGGIRASIYNAMPLAGVEKLAELMRQFQKSGGK